MKDKDNIFKVTENPSYLFIHIDNHKIKVRIFFESSEKGTTFKVDFIFENKNYKTELHVTQRNNIFYDDDINFQDIELHDIDKQNIADCLNEIMEHYFDY